MDALHLLGVIAAQTRRSQEAVGLFDKAIATKPDRAAFHNNRGLALRDLKRLKEALASVEQALELEPGLFDACNNRGMVLQELGRFDEALASYDQALALAPGFAHAHNNRGSVLRELERYDEALDSHNRALAISPDYAQAILNRGNVLRSQCKLDSAIADYEKALGLNPEFAEAYTCLASALQERGDIEEASKSYEQAIAIDPNDISPLLHLSRLREGKIPENLTSLWLRNMPEIAKVTTEPEQLFVKGNLLRHSGEIQEAFDHYLLANELIHRARSGQSGFPANLEEELLTCLKTWQPRKPIARNFEKVKYLFILGPSRSGKSTIESIVGKSDLVRKGYEGWRAGHARRALEGIHDSPGGYPLDDPSEIESAVAAYLFYYGAAEVARDGYRVLTCTNPFAIEVAHLVFDILPSSYFIFVQRDAISNAAEIFVTWYADRMDHAYDPETALDHVNWYRSVTDELAAKMEGRSMVISYGEFLGDTASGIRSIEKLIDLDLGVQQGLSGFAGRDEKSAFRECFLKELERRGVR